MEHSDRYHYHVIRRALDEIDNTEASLSLDDLATRMDMSPAHFWLGASAEKF